MFVYAWRQSNFTAEGTALVSDRCERCGTEFIYQVYRRGVGTGHSAYGLDNAGADHRAYAEAQRTLGKQLDNAVDPVKCPKCHYMQAHMVRRERLHRTWRTVAFGLVFAFIVAFVSLVFSISSGNQGAAFLIGGMLAMLPVTLLVLYWWIGWDPNKGAMVLWPVSQEVMDGGMTLAEFDAAINQQDAPQPAAPQAQYPAPQQQPRGTFQPAAYTAPVQRGAQPSPPPPPQQPAPPPPPPQADQPQLHYEPPARRNTAQKAPWEH